MTNNVEIEVTGQDRSGNLFERMRGSGARMGTTLTAALSKATAGSEQTRRQLSGLRQEIDQTSARAAELRREFARTGDQKIELDLKSTENDLKRLVRRFQDSGDDSAFGFSAHFSQRIGPLIARAPIGGPLLAVIAGTAPATTAIVSSAIAAGAAAGAVGLGAAIVAQEPVVQAAATRIGGRLSAALKVDARPMIQPVLAGLAVLDRRVDALRPTFQRVFKDAARFVPTFVSIIDSSLDRIGQGFANIVDDADPVVNMLGTQIPQVVNATMGAIENATEDSETSVKALSAAFILLTATINATGQSISFLNKALPVTSGVMLKLVDLIDGSGEKGKDAGFDLQEFINSLKNSGEAASGAAAEVRSYNDTLKERADVATNAFNAETLWGQAMDDSRLKLANAGEGISAHTTKGRENRNMLENLATQTRDSAEALGKLAGRQDDANKIVSAGYHQFMALAQVMGIDRKEAHKLAIQLGLIPSPKPKVKVQGGPAARAEAKRVEDRLEQLERTYHALVKVDYTGLLPSFAGDYRSAQRVYADGGIHGSPKSTAAAGGPRGSMTLVGERGAELVRLPFGSTVLTAGDTQRALRGGAAAGGGPWMGGYGSPSLEISTVPRAGDRLMDAIIEQLTYRINRYGVPWRQG